MPIDIDPIQSGKPPPLPADTEGSKRPLYICIVIQLILGVIWTLPLISIKAFGGEYAYRIFALLVFTCPVHLILIAVAIRSILKKPETKQLAMTAIALPFILLALPFVINALTNGQALLDSPDKQIKTLAVILLLILISTFAFPKRAALLLPRFALYSPAANGIILCFVGIVYLVPIGYAIVSGCLDNFGGYETTSNDTGYLIAYGAMFLLTYAALASVPLSSIFCYSYLGLLNTDPRRCKKLHIAQLIATLPGSVVGILLLFYYMTRG